MSVNCAPAVFFNGRTRTHRGRWMSYQLWVAFSR
jgi:hypothetical protein